MRHLGKACVVCLVVAIGGPAMAQTSSTKSTSVTTKIVQPVSLTKDSDLDLGTVVKPTSGANTVTIDATSGVRSLSGGGDAALATSAASRAAYTVNGEGGQTFSITAPGSVNLTRSGGSEVLTVALAKTATSGTLSGAIGSAGTATFGVGGSFVVNGATVSGSYSGSFDVTAAYN